MQIFEHEAHLLRLLDSPDGDVFGWHDGGSAQSQSRAKNDVLRALADDTVDGAAVITMPE